MTSLSITAPSPQTLSAFKIPATKVVGTALLLSDDAVATRQVTKAMQQLALSVEVCTEAASALDRINRRKYEAVVIDFAMTNNGSFLEQLRNSPSNRTAVTFAMTGSPTETSRALKVGARFALERPLTPDLIGHTLKAAFGMIMRERRRYFRFPVEVPVLLNRKGLPEAYGRTLNVSERGLAVSTSTPLFPGTEVTVQFTLPKPSLSITAQAKVCWYNDKGQGGFSFLFLPAHTASDLQEWLARRLEEEMPESVTRKFESSS